MVRRGSTVTLDDSGPDLDSQVIDEPSSAGNDNPWAAVLNGSVDPAVGGVDPGTLFTTAEVSSALGRPMNPPTTLQGTAFGPLGMRMAEFAALDGRARVLMQVATGRLAGAIGANRGERPSRAAPCSGTARWSFAAPTLSWRSTPATSTGPPPPQPYATLPPWPLIASPNPPQLPAT